MANIYNMTDTWTDGSTLTSIKMNVTDTSSAADSKLLDLQVGGSSKLTVGKDGAITAVQAGSVIPFYFDSQAAFPTASTYHGAVAHSHADSAIYFAHGGNWLKLVNVNNSGKVGIGTTSPIADLQIKSGTPLIILEDTNSTAGHNETALSRGSDFFRIQTRSNGTFISQDYQTSTDSNGATSHQWRIGNVEAMRIDGSRRVLINRTGQVAGYTSYLNIDHSGGSTYGIMLKNTSTSTSNALSFINSSDAEVGDILVSTTTTQYTSASDYRLKENVVDLTGAIDRLKLIPVHRFNFIADPDTTFDGFLAHEVQPHVPEAVHGEKDAVDSDGNMKSQMIDQGKLVPLLTAAIKEQQATIEALEARIAALESA